MNAKKVLYPIIVLVILLGSAACGGSAQTPAGETAAESNTQEAAEKPAAESAQAQLLFQGNTFQADQGTLRELYLVNADGSGLKQLTQGAYALYGGEWSPDGKSILYLSNKPIISGSTTVEVNPGVFVMNADGSQARLLTQEMKNSHYFASWHPDSKQILYTADIPMGGADIFSINSDGTGEKQLTDGIDRLPRWSPDGQQIVFSQGERSIALMKPDGSLGIVLAKDLLGTGSGYWSPDGQWVYFSGRFDGQPTNELFRIKPDGTGQENLTNQDGDDWLADFSPDGKQLLVVTTRDGNQEVYVMNADGSNPVNLSQNPAQESDADWSPDGTKIAFVSDRSGEKQVYVMNVDGTNVVHASAGVSGRALSPDWKPVK